MTDKSIVFPSDKIGVEEEFLSGEGIFVDQDHNLRAAIFGEVYTDRSRYLTKVFPKTRRPHIPKVGDDVIGSVERVHKYNMLVKVYYLNQVPVHPHYSAVMHITKASIDYLDSFDNGFASGDIIKAKVIDAHSIPIQLETKGREYGVIHCWCPNCGSPLHKTGKNRLQCRECGEKISRITSIKYGKEIIS